MRMYDLIMKKRNGGVLNEDEIKFMISGYTEGSIPDYQMSAMMMAVSEGTTVVTPIAARS